MHKRPNSEEYASYYTGYIGRVPDGSVMEHIVRQAEEVKSLFQEIGEEQAGYRYAPGKWSVKEVLGHIIDNERVMAYRLLRFARGDQTVLSGYDQDLLMTGAAFDAQPLPQLLNEYLHVRHASISLLQGLPAEAWDRHGYVNDRVLSVRALAYIIAGHELHHLDVLKERYGIVTIAD